MTFWIMSTNYLLVCVLIIGNVVHSMVIQLKNDRSGKNERENHTLHSVSVLGSKLKEMLIIASALAFILIILICIFCYISCKRSKVPKSEIVDNNRYKSDLTEKRSEQQHGSIVLNSNYNQSRCGSNRVSNKGSNFILNQSSQLKRVRSSRRRRTSSTFQMLRKRMSASLIDKSSSSTIKRK